MPVGAEPLGSGGGVHFRLWAPGRKRVEVVIEQAGSPGLRVDSSDTATHRLEPDGEGYFAGHAPQARPEALYRFRLDGGELLLPDPASRFQPQGPHGPSQVIDPATFEWTDRAWRGIGPAGQVIYEMHIGTFTREGTWQAAQAQLEILADLGITCLEIMPVSEFAGRFGWGYDGVDLFAPYHVYGTPDDFRRFVDHAHRLGLAVILDLVYNHLGPDGNYLREFSPDYFSRQHVTDWGESLNFDGENSGPVRELFISNAVYWIREFHLDGFRFDATQAIVDDSPEHLLAAISRQTRSVAAAAGRSIYITNENEPQNTSLVRPREQGGQGMDSLWNDDFHHAAMVALTGRNEAYFTDYHGSPQEFVSSAKWGYLYQGQRYKWQKRRRGTPALDLPPTAFVHFLQNHDQIANTVRGYRLHQLTSPGELRAMTAFMLLMPQTPMLFQGQEFAASSTFHYFADHNPELTELIRKGRAKEISQFPSGATEAMQEYLVDPAAEETFQRSKIDLAERQKPFHWEIFQLHKDLLRLRRDEPVFRRVAERGDLDGAVLGPGAFVLRFFGRGGDSGAEHPSAEDRLLVVNLGVDLRLDPAPEPLLASPSGCRWDILFSSESPQYGGTGAAPPDTEQEGWLLPGRCALVLQPRPTEQAKVDTRHRVEGSAQEAKRVAAETDDKVTR